MKTRKESEARGEASKIEGMIFSRAHIAPFILLHPIVLLELEAAPKNEGVRRTA